jgi:hypothetical protein
MLAERNFSAQTHLKSSTKFREEKDCKAFARALQQNTATLYCKVSAASPQHQSESPGLLHLCPKGNPFGAVQEHPQQYLLSDAKLSRDCLVW